MKPSGLAALAVLSAVTLAGADAPSPGGISLGAYLSMTGATASFGSSTRDGIELAIEQFNIRSKRKHARLELVDTAGKVSEGGRAVTQLADQGVIAILGEVASSVTLQGAAVAQKRGIPMITPSATNAAITDVGDLIFRACQVDDAQAQVMARFARKLGIAKVAILSDQSQTYSIGLTTSFETAFKAGGGTIVTKQAYKLGDSDFETQLRTIEGLKPQAVFVPGYFTDVAAIAQQAKRLGIAVRFLGADGWDSDQLGKLAGNALDGSYYVNHFAADDTRAVSRNFVKAFKSKYKHDPDSLAALGYDAANIALAAIDRASSRSGADVSAAIRATSKFPGVTGEISFHSGDQGITKPMAVLKVVGGKAVFAATVAP